MVWYIKNLAGPALEPLFLQKYSLPANTLDESASQVNKNKIDAQLLAGINTSRSIINALAEELKDCNVEGVAALKYIMARAQPWSLIVNKLEPCFAFRVFPKLTPFRRAHVGNAFNVAVMVN